MLAALLALAASGYSLRLQPGVTRPPLCVTARAPVGFLQAEPPAAPEPGDASPESEGYQTVYDDEVVNALTRGPYSVCTGSGVAETRAPCSCSQTPYEPPPLSDTMRNKLINES